MIPAPPAIHKRAARSSVDHSAKFAGVDADVVATPVIVAPIIPPTRARVSASGHVARTSPSRGA